MLFAFLLAVQPLLSCEDANWIIEGIIDTQMGTAVQSELILEVMLSTEDSCDFIRSN